MKKSAKFYGFATIILWATTFSFTKIALKSFQPETLGILRYMVASIFFLIWGGIQKIGLPKKADIPKFFLAGGLGFSLYSLLFNQASQTLTSGTGSIVIATAPIITAIFAYFIYKEKIRFLGWFAILIEFSGILILGFGKGNVVLSQGIIWMVLSAVCISGYNILQRGFAKTYTPLQATAYSIVAGTICLIPYLPKATGQIASAQPMHLLVVCFMGVFPSAIAYTWWSKGIALAKQTSEVTNFMFVTPFLAVLLGYVFLKEVPTIITCLGGGIILIGLVIFQMAGKSSQRNMEDDLDTLSDRDAV